MEELNKKRYLTVTIFFTLVLLMVVSVHAFIDLTINSTSIQFGSSDPIEGENITINATITNLGNESVSDTVVQFLNNLTEIGNTTINVSAFSTAITSQHWEAEIGPNNIVIVVDPNNNISESDENNNNASKNISIGAYHVYYGIAKGYLGLGIESDFLVKGEILSRNLLAADTDSNVDFSSLHAIGRKKNSGNAKNDFQDIDILLGMTAFTDSISTLFSKKNGNPKETETFTVFDYIIKKVPVVDSTNNDNFKTGILWDTSDDTDGPSGQFDISDQEDLIFITKINPSQAGQYGIYDYEIKIPALLRNYKPGSPSIDFFIDLDS